MDSNSILRGSICLSDIPKELIKQAKDGKCYLNINVRMKREPQTYTNGDISRTYTHSVQCACAKDKQRTDVKPGYYYIGDLETYTFAPAAPVTMESIDNAPAANVDALPF